MGQVSVPGAEVFRAAIDSDPALLDAGSRLIFLLLLLFFFYFYFSQWRIRA